jgi:hypothetical protein
MNQNSDIGMRSLYLLLCLACCPLCEIFFCLLGNGILAVVECNELEPINHKQDFIYNAQYKAVCCAMYNVLGSNQLLTLFFRLKSG